MSRLWVIALLILLVACDRSAEPESMPAMGDMRGMGGMGGMMQHEMAGSVDTVGLRGLTVPAEFLRGREIFQANCALCHGDAALGTAQGPPLVHLIYEPNHHADAAFVLAALRGVRAHHWGFGDMPPQPQVSREEVTEVVQYVRWLQRQAGVY